MVENWVPRPREPAHLESELFLATKRRLEALIHRDRAPGGRPPADRAHDHGRRRRRVVGRLAEDSPPWLMRLHPNASCFEEELPGGAMWSRVVRRHHTLRLTDVEGGANVGAAALQPRPAARALQHARHPEGAAHRLPHRRARAVLGHGPHPAARSPPTPAAGTTPSAATCDAAGIARRSTARPATRSSATSTTATPTTASWSSWASGAWASRTWCPT